MAASDDADSDADVRQAWVAPLARRLGTASAAQNARKGMGMDGGMGNLMRISV
ncbi:MAG: hypothetical protein KAZ48_08310 [Candidatus Nanopelagicales bacterium]|nr:hypothetical protein [Candidatus Nanopelagicales bacterium]